jgi:hypothetical protein
MHLTASPVWDAWSELSTRLPADLDLDAVARSTDAIQRCRGDGVRDGATLLQLSLARGPGGKSLQETAVWAHLNGLAELTSQSLNERLHGSVAFLAAITHPCWRAGRLAGRCCGRDAACVWPMAAVSASRAVRGRTGVCTGCMI